MHFWKKYPPKKGLILDAGGGPGRYRALNQSPRQLDHEITCKRGLQQYQIFVFPNPL
jgi:hypothetical protein